MAASLVARSFGGPHAAARAAANASDRECLDYAYGRGRKMIVFALRQQSKCVLAAHTGGTCDPGSISAKLATRRQAYADAIAARCPDLTSLIAIDPTMFTNRAADQAECLVATVHGQTCLLYTSPSPRDS